MKKTLLLLAVALLTFMSSTGAKKLIGNTVVDMDLTGCIYSDTYTLNLWMPSEPILQDCVGGQTNTKDIGTAQLASVSVYGVTVNPGEAKTISRGAAGGSLIVSMPDEAVLLDGVMHWHVTVTNS